MLRQVNKIFVLRNYFYSYLLLHSEIHETRNFTLTLCILMDSSFWFDTINLGHI